MNLLVLLIGISQLIFAGFCQENTVSIENLTDSRTTLIWKHTDAASIIVQAEEGYQITVEPTQFDVDGHNDNYVTVKSISTDDDEGVSLMFTYTLNGQPTYLYNYNKVQADYVGSTESNLFSIKFTRVGEATTTTPESASTSTPEAIPTASPEEKKTSTLTVYLYGRAAAEFRAPAIESLRKAIAAMGAAYCEDQSCPLNGSITMNNVKIENLEPCPLLWQHYASCVNVTFALPIVKLDQEESLSIWDDYQLNHEHLKIMWDNYAKEYIQQIGLTLYPEPNIDKMFKARLIMCSLIIVALVILILVARHYMERLNKRRRKFSDTVSVLGQESSDRISQTLPPHYLQELPPLFSSDFPMTYTDQNRSQNNFTEFSNFVTEEVEPTAPTSPNLIDVSSIDLDELEDADA